MIEKHRLEHQAERLRLMGNNRAMRRDVLEIPGDDDLRARLVAWFDLNYAELLAYRRLTQAPPGLLEEMQARWGNDN